MCNRYASEKARDELGREYQVAGNLPIWEGSDDIRPTNWAPIVALGQDRTRRLVRARWGLVDHAGKVIKNTMNARSERLLELASWRAMFLAYPRKDGSVTPPRRCLIPFTAFYEYTDEGRTKKPWTLRVTGNRSYAMAGLYRSFQPPAPHLESGQRLPEDFSLPAKQVCFTMLMCDPDSHEIMRDIHDRMPVILEEDQFPAWLGEEDASTDDLLAMMKAYPAKRMEALPTAPFSSSKSGRRPSA